MSRGEGVIEDSLTAFRDDFIEGKRLFLVFNEFGDPLGAPADVHRFVDDVVEDGFGGSGVVELKVILVGVVFEGEGVLLDDVGEDGVAAHGVVELAPCVVADELRKFLDFMAEFANTFFAHFTVSAFVVTMTGDIIIEFPVHAFDFPKNRAKGFGRLHFHGVGDKLPESVCFGVFDRRAFEAVEFCFEPGITFSVTKGKKTGVAGRRGGKVGCGILSGDAA